MVLNKRNTRNLNFVGLLKPLEGGSHPRYNSVFKTCDFADAEYIGEALVTPL